jgi:hypothetical protein
MLRERQRRLLTEHFENGGNQIRLVASWIQSQPLIMNVLHEAGTVEADLDVQAFVSSVLTNSRDLQWPASTEGGQATLIWAVMRQIELDALAQSDRRSFYTLGRQQKLQDGWQDFVERLISPLFDYLLERLGQYSSTLHTIERYVHLVEWFSRDELHARYLQRTSTGEEVYNDDLQRFLFQDAGLATHAKVRSASGEADLTGGLDTIDPLICEGKLFDDRGVRYLASGVHQLVKYAHDHRKTVAYLVIFNMTEKLLQFDSEDPSGWPTVVRVAGVDVNLVVVRAKPPAATASKSGRATVVTVAPAQLTDPD